MRVYYDRDADVNLIKSKKVVIVGYGSQGHAHAINLRDSGAKEIAVALRSDSTSRAKAEAEGIRVMDVSDAAKWADVVMMLTPDELQRHIYRDHLHENMKENAALVFAHGLNIHFKLIEPRSDLDVFMVAPKGPGHTVRSEYVRGGGVPCRCAGRDRQCTRHWSVLCLRDWWWQGRHHRDDISRRVRDRFVRRTSRFVRWPDQPHSSRLRDVDRSRLRPGDGLF